MTTCYRCEDKATSFEHVPPRCLFPEKKDVTDGKNYRINLIKVPSCEVHNTAKSKDDEYLLCTIVTSYENNVTAQALFSSKVIRALRRTPYFQKTILKEVTPVLLNGVSTIAFKLDVARINNELECIAHALYFHTYKKICPWLIRVIPLSLLKLEGTSFVPNPLQEQMLHGTEFFQYLPQLGENPDIFYYQIHMDEMKEQLTIRMVFYGGFEVVALSSPTLASAANTTMHSDVSAPRQ
jgi:hypothetical protein